MTTPTRFAVLARTARLQLIPPAQAEVGVESSSIPSAQAEHVESTSIPSTQAERVESTYIELHNFTVAAGTLIKVLPASDITAQEPAVASTVQVYVYDTVFREPDTTRIFQCTRDSLLPVSDDLWPFIVSIPEPQRRLQLLLDHDRCEWLSNAMPGDLVYVPRRCFAQEGNVRYDCIICYIGPVPEIHPVGYFFGLELLDDTPSPHATDIPFTRRYFECDAENAIFTTADRIIPIPPAQDEEPETAESANEAPAGDWSIITMFNNALDSIRASLPI
ncbi:PREDICTED: uncharacterized protein LOC108361557 [Rhagoletis zephyria]|uniref:uncharacterized protein LOC108361557 n=1 Tax=Rhagoletis zephyria TaxID=28612 RepID=UPI00081134B2|nr:PREDICTED: uncharacterized protein LOC108361557 [Rhagoletis zephyria]